MINGHPASWLDGVTFDNVKLYQSSDSTAPYDKSVHAMTIQYAKNLKLRNVEVFWRSPVSARWKSALSVTDVSNVVIDDFGGAPAPNTRDEAAIRLARVKDATIRNSIVPEEISVFVSIAGSQSSNIALTGNDMRKAKRAFVLDQEVAKNAVTMSNNLMGVR